MARNQLPEGVGKKIVEALKRQAEADITPVGSLDGNLSSGISLNDFKETSDINFDSMTNTNVSLNNQTNFQTGTTASVENFIIEDDANLTQTFDVQKMKDDNYNSSVVKEGENELSFNIPKAQEEPAREQILKETVVKEPVQETPIFKAGNETTTVMFNQPTIAPVIPQYTGTPLSEEPKKTVSVSSVTISIPTNVAVLRNLIASLPVGVTKQTGAQIIRQTLEAMGLPMASVLKEAQEVQEELNTNTRECMLKIQEYKTNIMQLEQSVQEYQKNITQINDLVSLFLLTDRK